MIVYRYEPTAFTVPELMDLFARAATWRIPRETADWRDLVANTPLLVSAWDGPHLVGFARLLTDFVRWANFGEVVVAREHQRRGIGTELVRRLLDHPRVARVRTFWLGTEDAFEFYERLGFRRDGTGHGMLLVRRDRDGHLVASEALTPRSEGGTRLATETFVTSAGRRLVGTLRECGSGGVVVLAHGFTSDRRSKGRFPRMTEALARAGISSLAFDFGGCGESDDVTLTLDTLVEDLHAAIAFVRGRGLGPVALLGHSLGSFVALRGHDPDVVAMVLTGALTGPMHYRWDEHFSAEQLRFLGETGRLVVSHREGPRQETVVAGQLLRDFEHLDAAPLLSALRCPVLVMHGDGDDEERLLLRNTRARERFLPPGSRVEVLPGAGHDLLGVYGRVIDLAVEWLVRHLSTVPKRPRRDGVSTTIRSPSDTELDAVLRLVVEVVIETYGGECPALAAALRQDPSSEFGTPESWRQSLVAEAGDGIAGVAQVEGSRVSDLWVAGASRGHGIGSALLAACEERIRSAGHDEARLDVVSTNERALAFYRARGWVEVGRRPSPRWPLPPYVELVKALR